MSRDVNHISTPDSYLAKHSNWFSDKREQSLPEGWEHAILLMKALFTRIN